MKRPAIVTLCGSSKYDYSFRYWEAVLALHGVICLSMGVFPHHIGMDMKGERKRRLEWLQFAKIRLSDAIIILNVDTDLGLSTCQQLLFAISQRVSIFFAWHLTNSQVVSIGELLRCDCQNEYCLSNYQLLFGTENRTIQIRDVVERIRDVVLLDA